MGRDNFKGRKGWPIFKYLPCAVQKWLNRPAKYRWRPLLNAVDQIARISLWCNLGTKKWCAVLSNYKANVHKTSQLWLERNVVSCTCFSFSISSLVFKLLEFKVTPSPNCGENLQIFAPKNLGDTDRSPSDLRYKITLHSNILAKVPRGGVLRPGRLVRKK